MKLASYFLASWIAMLPGTLAYVYFGSALGDVTGSATALQKTIKISLAVAAVVATIFIARIAAKAIKNAGVDEGRPPAAPVYLTLSERTETFWISGGRCETSSRRSGVAGAEPSHSKAESEPFRWRISSIRPSSRPRSRVMRMRLKRPCATISGARAPEA